MTSLYDNRRGATHANLAVAALLAIFFFSTAAKWATTHIAGALIALGLLAARRDFWLSPPARAYTAVSLMWLLPVIGATALQHAQDLVTATLWSKQATLILRILGIGLGILFILHKRWISLRQLTIIAMGCLLIHGLIGIGQWALHPDTGLAAWRTIRIEGIVGNPNPYSFYMALGLVLSAALLHDDSTTKHQRLALWASAAVFVLGIAGSGSRGAVLTATAGIVVLFPPTTPRRIGAYFLTLGSLVVAYLTSGWHDIDTYSDGTRVAALRFSLEAISQRPLGGWGFGSYIHIPGHSGINAPHNMLADLALSSGIPSLAAFMGSLLLVGYRLLQSRTSHAHTLLALLTCAVVAGTLEYSLLSSTHFRGPWVLLVALTCYATNPTQGRCALSSATSHSKGAPAS
ncbi:O-antigen ligase family protein [Thauera sp. ZXT1-4]|uniref:O-antigen ligase family protein n=1 Tax=Thauera sp. ZXT1-4 TaxID=3460294 RepID=UPI004040A48F